MVQQLTELMGGTVTLTSEVGRRQHLHGAAAQPAPGPAPGGARRVLDDDPPSGRRLPARGADLAAAGRSARPRRRRGRPRAGSPPCRRGGGQRRPAHLPRRRARRRRTTSSSSATGGRTRGGAPRGARPRAQRRDDAGARRLRPRRRHPRGARPWPACRSSCCRREPASSETSTALGAGADDYLVKPFSVLELRARVASNLERAGARTQDASWRRAVLDGLHDALVILDLDGTVLEVSDRFTGLLGWSARRRPVGRALPVGRRRRRLAGAASRMPSPSPPRRTTSRVRSRRCCVTATGRRVVGSVRVSLVEGGRNRPARLLATVRDVTAEHEARERRATAAAWPPSWGRPTSSPTWWPPPSPACPCCSAVTPRSAWSRAAPSRSSPPPGRSLPTDLDPEVAAGSRRTRTRPRRARGRRRRRHPAHGG